MTIFSFPLLKKTPLEKEKAPTQGTLTKQKLNLKDTKKTSLDTNSLTITHS